MVTPQPVVEPQSLLFRAGERFLTRAEYAEARLAFTLAEAAGLDSDDLHYDLAFADYMLGDYPAAERRMLRLLERDRDEDWLFFLARIYDKQGRFDESMKLYQELHPGWSWPEDRGDETIRDRLLRKKREQEAAEDED